MENNLPEFEFSLEEEFPVDTPKEEVETTDEPTENSTDEPITQGDPFEVAETVTEETTEGTEHYKALLEFYKDKGLVNYDEYDGSVEKFEEILTNNINNYYEQVENEIIGAAPDEAKSVMEYILAKGADFKREDLSQFLTSSVPEEFDDNSAKNYLLSIYTDKLGKSKAEKLIEALEDDGNLVEEAKTEAEQTRAKLKEQEQAIVQQTKEQKAQAKARQMEFKQNLSKELESFKWPKEIKDNVINDLYSGQVQAKTKEIVKYPKALLQLTNYLRYLDPKTGEINEEQFAKQSYSKAASKLKSDLDKHFRSSAFSKGTTKQDKQDNNVQYEFA